MRNKYTKLHTCFDIARQIAWVRYEEGYNETEGRVKSFLVLNECNLSCYIKTSVWFCIYYIRYIFFTNEALFGMHLGYVIGVSNKRSNRKRDVTMLLRQSAPNIRINHPFILKRLMCRRNPRYSCTKTEKVVPFSVSHMCVIQTFLSHGLKNACVTMVGFNAYVIYSDSIHIQYMKQLLHIAFRILMFVCNKHPQYDFILLHIF